MCRGSGAAPWGGVWVREKGEEVSEWEGGREKKGKDAQGAPWANSCNLSLPDVRPAGDRITQRNGAWTNTHPTEHIRPISDIPQEDIVSGEGRGSVGGCGLRMLGPDRRPVLC